MHFNPGLTQRLVERIRLKGGRVGYFSICQLQVQTKCTHSIFHDNLLKSPGATFTALVHSGCIAPARKEQACIIQTIMVHSNSSTDISMPGSDLGTSCTLSQVTFTMILEVGMVTLTVHMRKLGFTKVEYLACEHRSHDQKSLCYAAYSSRVSDITWRYYPERSHVCSDHLLRSPTLRDLLSSPKYQPSFITTTKNMKYEKGRGK